MNREELKQSTAKLIGDLRTRQGLNQARMAKKLNIDPHTWNSWESGKTSPSVVEFVNMFSVCGESMMRATLEMLYPEQYRTESDIDREKMIRFVSDVATDHAAEVMNFIAFGNHGSSYSPQAELFCAYNHLPMEQRFLIAESIYVAFLIAQNRGDLVAKDAVMPDMETLKSGLKAGQKAAYTHLQSYNTLTEE